MRHFAGLSRLTGLSGLAFAATLSLAAPAQAATNLILNGSFETGDFTNWNYSGTVGDSDPAVVINYNSATPYPTGAFGEAVPPPAGSASPDPAGTHGAYFVSDSADETIFQLTTLTAGVTYKIGFSVYAPANGLANAGDATISGYVAGESFFSPISLLTTNWLNASTTIVVAVTGSYLTEFNFNSNFIPSNDVVIDQVYISPSVPEPSTWAMLVVGFLGLGVAAHMSGRKPAAA